MRDRVVRTALVHGDFAVWNLRLLPTGPAAIDWEWAVEEGAAGIDFAHGLRQEAVMLRRLNTEPGRRLDPGLGLEEELPGLSRRLRLAWSP